MEKWVVMTCVLTTLVGEAKTCWNDPESGRVTSVTVTAADGSEFRVDALADNLFRIRVKKGGAWTESGLNRYGMLKREWDGAKDEWRTATGFKTPSAEISVDGASGKVTFRSAVSPAAFSVEPAIADEGYRVRFPLAKDERIYGLGDVCRKNIQRRPGVYDIWVKNKNSYIPIPMAMTSRRWGVLMNTTWRNVFDVGKTDPDAMICTAETSALDFYLFCGRDYKALLDIYTQLSGRPTLLPAFGYGFTYVCNENIDMFHLVDDALRFRDMDLPIDVMGLEPGWMNPRSKYDLSVRKKWDREKFEFGWAPAGDHTFIGALNRIGVKLSLWLCCNYDLFKYEEECVSGKYFDFGAKVNVKEGTIEKFKDTRVEVAGKTMLDNPDAQQKAKKEAAEREAKIAKGLEGDEPWFAHLRKFVQQGAQCFKLDGANQVSEHPGRKWSNGMDDEEAHNLYPVVYDKQMSRGYETYTKKRAMVYSAGGYAGVQQYVATWAGDTGGGDEPCCSLINLGMSGHPNQSCDMDIFNVRALHFGFLQTWSQENSWAYWFQPWLQRKQGLDTFRKYAHLRYRLIPYIYTAAACASRSGWPVVRALPLVYPDNPAYDACKTTYMLGDNLLVAAFTKTITLPPGMWHEWRTDEPVAGGKTVPLSIDATWGGGLYVKAGAIIPTWPVRECIDHGWSNEVVFEVWPSADGESELYEDDGISLAYRDGCWAAVPLRVRNTADGCVFRIGRRHGSDKGTFVTPGRPAYSARVHALSKPISAMLDGSAVVGVWCEKSRTFSVDLGAVPVDGCELVLKCKGDICH